MENTLYEKFNFSDEELNRFKNMKTRFLETSYKNLPLTNIKRIIGPYTFTEHKYGFRKFFIFGECHKLDNSCKVKQMKQIVWHFLDFYILY